jgi:hypothetical protein
MKQEVKAKPMTLPIKPLPAGATSLQSALPTNLNLNNSKYMKLFKNPNNNKDTKISSFVVDYNCEIIKYHLMRNKNYLLCATRNKLLLFNIMKLRRIAEFFINTLSQMTFEKMVEILDKYDTITLKSWFAVDIKLGVVSINFSQENMFNNPFNFDVEYLEKVLDRTNSFTKSVIIDFKFLEISSPVNKDLNRTMNSKTSDNSGLRSDTSKFSSTMPTASDKKGKTISNNDKISSCGYILFKMVYSNYSAKMVEKYSAFYDEYFWDTRDYLKNEISRIDTGKYINNNLFNLSCSTVPTFFLFATYENFISVAPYFEDLSYKFRLPSFIKEILQIVKIIFCKYLFLAQF